jgi:hypothetical protein
LRKVTKDFLSVNLNVGLFFALSNNRYNSNMKVLLQFCYAWLNPFEDIVISCYPDTLAYENEYIHEERNIELLLEIFHYLND